MVVVFTKAGAFQYVQYTLLIWQEHRRCLHINQPSHLANDLSDYSMWFERADYSVRRFKQRVQLTEFFQSVTL